MSERTGKLKTLASAKQRFKESCTDTIREAELVHPLAAAQRVWSIPTDLAVHGFSIEMSQSSTLFAIEIERKISGHLFSATGTGKSLLSALKALSVNAVEGFTAIETSINSTPDDLAA